jgi:hypothetical protein
MPHYVLDAANFIISHLRGDWGGDNERFRLNPMMDDKESRLYNLFDSGFKADFTRVVGRVWTTGRVPPTGKISSQLVWFNSYNAGDEFRFRIDRCHLSSGIHDYVSAICELPKTSQFDLMSGFEFWGSLLQYRVPQVEYSPNVAFADYTEVPMFVPGRWITHALNENNLLIPLPWELTATGSIQ